jgi:hypothetical protein
MDNEFDRPVVRYRGEFQCRHGVGVHPWQRASTKSRLTMTRTGKPGRIVKVGWMSISRRTSCWLGCNCPGPLNSIQKIDGRMAYFWRAVDAEGEVPNVLFGVELALIPLWYPQFTSAALDWVDAAIVVVVWELSGSARLSALLCRGTRRAQIGVAAWAAAF